jgi:DNA-binding response OmpR family regulator
MEPCAFLVIARTQSLATRLRSAFEAERYPIRWVSSAALALKLDFDPALLIVELPPSGGERSVARLKRQFNVPLLALLRLGQSAPEQVDAFLTRPCSHEGLVELIQVTLINHSRHMIRASGMALDRETRRLQINGALFQLRPIGCDILSFLLVRAGQVVPRDELFRSVWHTEDGDNTRALDVHIAQLRQQLEADPRRPRLILTERGVGYRLQPPE